MSIHSRQTRRSSPRVTNPAGDDHATRFPFRAVAERLSAPWSRAPDGAPLYPGGPRTLSADERAARMASGAPYALRLDMNAALERSGALTWVETGVDREEEHETLMAHAEAWGDVVLARKETP